MNTILIIDDQVKRLANLQRIIEEKFEKCTVLTAPGGAKGFEIARRKKPDAILIDTQIADIDAYQLCGQIKADQLTCSVPVLLITDLKTNPECGGKIIESGADTALSRPFDPIEVFLQLRLLFRIKEKKDHLQGTPEAVESELLQSREQYKSDYDRYRLMADNSPDMMWAKDMEGRFTFTNKAICDNLLNAKDVNEPIGKDVMFFVDRERKEHPENLRWFTFGEDCADSDSVTIEKRQTCRFDEYGNVFGKYLFLDVYKTPLWNEHGEMTGTVGNARIVTKEREVEKALKESEEMLRNILENSTNLFYSHTVDHVITYLSPQVEEILGYTQEEALVRWTHLASDNLLNEKGFQHTERAIKTGERQPPYELELLKKGGDKIWVEVREFPQLDGGVAKSIIGSLTEITERKHTEHIREVIFNISKASLSSLNLEKLMAYIRIELGTIIDTSNFFIALKDKDNDRITLPFFDDEKDHLSILPEGKTLTNYVISTDKPLLVDSFEKKKMTADGKIELFGSLSKKWLGVPLRLENEVIGVLAVQSYTDENAYDDADMKMLEFVSDQISVSIHRKKTEEDLHFALKKAKESDHLKSAFLANMSHEIRTPMNGILGFAELLKDPDITGDEHEKYVSVIESSGERMLSTINDLIDISKIESKQTEVQYNRIRINELTDDLYRFFNPETERKGLQLILNNSLPVEKSLINTDREKLYAILTNLIKNSIKYTQKGRIEFGYQRKESFIEFYVEDTGIGIPEEHHKSIFDRFVQAEMSNFKRFEGSGLGLSITKAYVEMLGGEIWLISETGKGSKFSFTIPK